MSKAFTSEETEVVDVALPPRPRLLPGEKRYVTQQGYEALQRELERLSAAGAVREPRAQALAATLADLTVVLPDASQAGRAYFGAWVTLEDEEGAETTYRLVGPDETDAKAGLVSVESPLGRALLGKSEGDEISVERPRGRADYTLLRVRY